MLSFLEGFDQKVRARFFLVTRGQIMRLLGRNESHRFLQTLAKIQHIVDVWKHCKPDLLSWVHNQVAHQARQIAYRTTPQERLAALLVHGSPHTCSLLSGYLFVDALFVDTSCGGLLLRPRSTRSVGAARVQRNRVNVRHLQPSPRMHGVPSRFSAVALHGGS